MPNPVRRIWSRADTARLRTFAGMKQLQPSWLRRREADVEFTQQQLRAIDVDRFGQDMCVVAGPGSGKTTVLVERFRRLVCEAGIPPSRILAITFTERAATNMKQKLAAAFHDRPGDRRQLERAYVSTVHGFCMRLLRENAIFAGIDPEFRLMDERQADTLQRLTVN